MQASAYVTAKKLKDYSIFLFDNIAVSKINFTGIIKI